MKNKKSLNDILKSENIIRKRGINGYGNFLIINSALASAINNNFNEEKLLRRKKLLKERTKKIKKLKRIINENSTNNRR